jgi:hypothetical protein
VRRALAFAVPFTLVFVVGVLAVAWARGWLGPDPKGQVVPITFDDLDDPPPYVRISGMAHYAAVVEQHVPGGLFREPTTWYLFGLFPPWQTEDRQIRVIVRTTREPERLVSYEVMTLEGRLAPPTLRELPLDTETILSRGSDYYLAPDVWLLEPWSIEEGLGTAPESPRP